MKRTMNSSGSSRIRGKMGSRAITAPRTIWTRGVEIRGMNLEIKEETRTAASMHRMRMNVSTGFLSATQSRAGYRRPD